MILNEFLRYVCIFCTKGYRSLFKTEELRGKMRNIIINYFDQVEKKDGEVKLISVSINSKHVEITFEVQSKSELTNYESKSQTVLTKFISNLKSITSRKFLQYLSTKSGISGVWTKNYLLATQEYRLDQKIESFLQAQEYKSIL